MKDNNPSASACIPTAQENSVILVGMPGAGKSTIGILLAKALAKDFVDTDVLIQLAHCKTLNQILHDEGYLGLRQREEEVLLAANYTDHVIATGGSAVYSEKAMQHLKKFGPVIFLDVAQDELERRIFNMDSRGIARHPTQSFSDLYRERRELYLHYADLVVDGTERSQDQLVEDIVYWSAQVYVNMDA